MQKGWTPLLCVAYRGYANLVDILLKAGANIDTSNKVRKFYLLAFILLAFILQDALLCVLHIYKQCIFHTEWINCIVSGITRKPHKSCENSSCSWSKRTSEKLGNSIARYVPNFNCNFNMYAHYVVNNSCFLGSIGEFVC